MKISLIKLEKSVDIWDIVCYYGTIKKGKQSFKEMERFMEGGPMK